MPRVIAYSLVLFLGFGVFAAAATLIWAIFFDGKGGDLKGIGAMLFFLVWWAWAGVSVYARFIKAPREERRRQCAEATEFLAKSLSPGLSLSAGIKEMREKFPLIGEPRHRSDSSTSFDTAVELETRAFIISIFAKDGVIKSWSLR